MADFKKMEIKSICLFSVFKYFGGIALVAGLVIGLFGSTLKIDPITPELASRLPLMSKIAPGIPTAVAFAVIYGLSAGIGASVFALLYNLFAGILGGIKLFVKDE